jgi:F-type H+-transporting ATPase subunit delta
VTPRAAARRYAGALFDVVRTGGDIERANRDLAAFRDLVVQHAELARVFETPAVAPQKKRAIVEQILAAASDISPEVGRLLVLLADRDRLVLLPVVAEAFAARVLDARRAASADVVTAVPLGEAARAALAQALGRAVGRDVTIRERVDPSIIGGVVARIGSIVFDGSVVRQLDRLRERLLHES